MRTLLVNGGNIEDDFALPFMKKEKFDYIIAVDKGMEFCRRAGILPNEILGDFDSVNPQIKKYFEQQEIPVHVYKPEKDQTDMENAMTLAIKRKSTEIVVLGATGTRMDHVLGSIRNLSLAMHEKIPCVLLDAHNRICMTDHTLTIRKSEQYGKYVSLLAFGGPVEKLTLEGFYYPLTDHTMGPESALGISNEITAEEAVIHFTSGTLIVIESKD